MELLTHWAAVWGIQPPVLGLLLQVLSTACLAVMSLVAKLGGKLGLPVFELVLARSLVLLAMSTAMLARRGAAAEWPWRSNRCRAAGLRQTGPGQQRCSHCRSCGDAPSPSPSPQ